MKTKIKIIICCVTLLGLAGLSLHISQLVQDRRTDLLALNTKIKHEQNTIRILNAEWAMLNAPIRLEELAVLYGIDIQNPADHMITHTVHDVLPNADNAMASLASGTTNALSYTLVNDRSAP